MRWTSSPDQINPAMLDDIVQRVSAAMPDGKKTNKPAILALINSIITEHYHGQNKTV